MRKSQRIKQRTGKSQPSKQGPPSKSYVQTKVGKATFQIYDTSTVNSQEQFVKRILDIKENEFEHQFAKRFPFFLQDFLKYYKKMEKRFKQISKEQQRYLKEKYQYCNKFNKLINWLFNSTSIISQQKWIKKLQQLQLKVPQNCIKLIFKNVIEHSAKDFRLHLSNEENTFRSISHIGFPQLKHICIYRSHLNSLEPLQWVFWPNIQHISIGYVSSLPVKSLAKCQLPKLKYLCFSYTYQFDKNILSHDKKGVNMQYLCRAKLHSDSGDIEQCMGNIFNPIILTKIQWRQFYSTGLNVGDNYPNVGSTYNCTRKAFSALRKLGKKNYLYDKQYYFDQQSMSYDYGYSYNSERNRLFRDLDSD